MSVDLHFDHFNKLPLDLKEEVWDYSDEDSLLHTPYVCKEWHGNSLLKGKLKKISDGIHSSEKEGYPRKTIHLFRKCKQSISKMPVLRKYYKRMHPEEPITVHLPRMSQPIMKFQERFGAAIAMKVEVVADETIPYLNNEMQAQGLKTVLILLKRRPRSLYGRGEIPWSFCWGDNHDTIERLYTKVHRRDDHQEGQEPCPDCPFTRPDGWAGADSKDIHPKLLENLLLGQDPICVIPGLNNPNPTEEEAKRE